MKKHYTLYNIGKLLILSCVLLLGGTEVAMGQRINQDLAQHQLGQGGAVHAAALFLQDLQDDGVGQRLIFR